MSTTILIAVISTLGVGAVIVAMTRKRSPSSTEQEKSPRATPAAPTPEDIVNTNASNLTSTIHRLALTEKLDQKLLAEFVRISHDIIGLLFPLNKHYPLTELTYTINALCNDYFVKLVDSYTSSSEKVRGEKSADLITILQGLDDDIEKARKSVDSGNEDEFDKHAEFLKRKFA
jgi:hypothetical protein